jgi:hypothetical protein
VRCFSRGTASHVTGQALITTLYGAATADEIGDMHERGQGSLMSGDIPQNEQKQAIDNYADLINNEFGQMWGSQIQEELGITSSTTWTPELTSSFLNSLQGKIGESMGIEFNKQFTKDDQFVKDYTNFINENK